jgi:hypothetical protein
MARTERFQIDFDKLPDERPSLNLKERPASLERTKSQSDLVKVVNEPSMLHAPPGGRRPFLSHLPLQLLN